MSSPALTIVRGNETFTFDDDELTSLSAMSFLFGSDGAKMGRALVTEATLSEREIVMLATFAAAVKKRLSLPLTVYDHGRGVGTVCFQQKPWYELVKKSGVHYLKPTQRHVNGALVATEDVIYAKGRSVKGATMPQTLGDVKPLTSALEKLERVASGAGPVRVTPRTSYEYF